MRGVVHKAVFMFVFLFPVLSFPQVDFNGEWLFDKTKSEYGPDGDQFVPIKLHIAQTDSTMLIVRTYQLEYQDDFVDSIKFTLDEQENHSLFWQSPRVITAGWKNNGQTLTIRTQITFRHDGESNETLSTDIWNLTNAGREILRDFTIDGPWGELKAIYVFNKVTTSEQ